MTQAYIREVDRWVRCEVLAIHEDGTARIALAWSGAELVLKVYKLREKARPS